nr:putative oxidoreductase [Quercus suber]
MLMLYLELEELTVRAGARMSHHFATSSFSDCPVRVVGVTMKQNYQGVVAGVETSRPPSSPQPIIPMPSYLIVGASRGLGFAWLEFLSKCPENEVFGLVRDKETARQRLDEHGVVGCVNLVQGDITDLATLRRSAVEIATMTGGSLDVLINNAVSPGKTTAFRSLAEVDTEILIQELEETFQTNTIGTANLIAVFLPLIRKGQEKKIVGISSLLADMELTRELGLDHAGPYSVSKAATNALLSKYHAAIGIKENIVFMSLSPGVVATAKPEPKGDEIAKREEVRLKLKSYAPNFTKPLLPLDSVALQWNVIMGATVQSHGGEFVSHTGTSKWLSCDALPKDEIHGMASTKDILGTSSIKSAMSRASERNPMRERSRQNPIMALWLKLNPRQ